MNQLSQTRRRNNGGLARVIQERELGGGNPNTHLQAARYLATQRTPNETIYNVQIPSISLRRFTPDGKYLICFTRSGYGIQLYYFNGPSCLERPQADTSANTDACPDSNGDSSREWIDWQGTAFSSFFSLKYEKMITTATGDPLNDDFCLITNDQRYMILASSVQSSTTPAEAKRYPCSLTCIVQLDDITFYLVDINTGEVVDKILFKGDRINIARHTGVSICGSLFSVLSIQNQSIHIFQIKDTGKFHHLRTIGWLNQEDDELVLARHRELEEQYTQECAAVASGTSSSSVIAALRKKTSAMNFPDFMDVDDADYPMYRSPSVGNPVMAPSISMLRTASNVDPTDGAGYHLVPNVGVPNLSRLGSVAGATGGAARFNDSDSDDETLPISGIKQRLITCLFRRAYNANDDGQALQHFYLTFSQFASLVLWKMQFLDGSHLLIKLTNVETALSHHTEVITQTAFFVIYNLTTTEIVGIYDNASQELLQLYEQHADEWRGYGLDGHVNLFSTCSNNAQTREVYEKHLYAMRHARNGGQSSSVKRILANLPFPPQSFCESPYLDQGLFSYDEKLISAHDRPKPCQDAPIKFFSRTTGEMKFKINTNPQHRQTRGFKKYANFIAHPVYPFIISAQHTVLQPLTVNFHVVAEH